MTLQHSCNCDCLTASSPLAQVCLLLLGIWCTVPRSRTEKPCNVLQYLINNAGVAKWADLGSLQEADMLHLFRTNTLGPLMITQEVLREGLLKSGSVIANMTSKVSDLLPCV